jgi:MFS family permease
MARALRGFAIEVFWSGTSFLLASTVFQPVIGSFSHIFGRKPMIYISLAFFTVGSIIAALAKGFDIIIVGRSIQGIGGGGIIALTGIVVTDMVPLRERGKCKTIYKLHLQEYILTSSGLSIISAVWAIGTVGGPVLGRFVFYCQGVQLTYVRRWLRAKRHLALDLLDKSALHRTWGNNGCRVPQT